jgi:hypothetical protein
MTPGEFWILYDEVFGVDLNQFMDRDDLEELMRKFPDGRDNVAGISG